VNTHVLLLDNNKNRRSLISEVLRPYCLTLSETETGSETIERIKSEEFNLLLISASDVSLTYVCRQLHSKFIQIPIVIISSEFYSTQQQDLANCGTQIFLTKDSYSFFKTVITLLSNT
jgi:CheY-like chemotaxis protein